MNLLVINDGKLAFNSETGNLSVADPDDLMPCDECCCPAKFHVVATGLNGSGNTIRITFDLPKIKATTDAPPIWYSFDGHVLLENLVPPGASLYVRGGGSIQMFGYPSPNLFVGYDQNNQGRPPADWTADNAWVALVGKCPAAGTYIGSDRGWTITLSPP